MIQLVIPDGTRTLVTMRPKIDSKPKDHKVDNDF